MNSHVFNYLFETRSIINTIIDSPAILESIQCLAEGIRRVRALNRRLFILGLGGSAANASHAVNDLRKLCNVEAYAPTDNVSEFSARANDEGLHTVFEQWLKTSQLCPPDALLVLSVGGGTQNVSRSLVNAIEYARVQACEVWSIVGREIGYAQSHSDICIQIPDVNVANRTPHAEEFQSILLHLLVSHPSLKINKPKW